MKITKLDVSVAILAGIACYTMLAGLPVWAIFIGWAWYFVLGATPAAFKQAIPPMILGYVLAAVSILVFTASGFQMPVLAVIVAITVFVVMLSLKSATFSCSIASFNAYSCMFAGYYAANFPKSEAMALDINNVAICALWLALSNVIGLALGYVSVRLGVGKAGA